MLSHILSGIVIGVTIAVTLYTLANFRAIKVRLKEFFTTARTNLPTTVAVPPDRITVGRRQLIGTAGLCATFFGAGWLRPASGTWASAIAVGLAVLVYQAGLALLVPVGAVLATIAGFIAVPPYLRATGGKDPSEVVIDEVAGQWLALSFTVLPLWWQGVPDLLTGTWPGWVAPFLLFRLFDIWKPWVIGRADRRHDAAGVMLDDLWAGLFAGLGSVVLAGLYHGLVA